MDAVNHVVPAVRPILLQKRLYLGFGDMLAGSELTNLSNFGSFYIREWIVIVIVVVVL